MPPTDIKTIDTSKPGEPERLLPLNSESGAVLWYKLLLDTLAQRSLLQDLMGVVEVIQPGAIVAMRRRRLISLKEAEAGLAIRPEQGLNAVDLILAELEIMAVTLGDDGTGALFAPVAGRA